MKYSINIFFLLIVSLFHSCYNKDLVNCTNNNYMSKKNINPKNNYENRREIKTIFSRSDFNISDDKFGLSCSVLLSNYFYCNICFESDENSLTSYDGKKYIFKKNISPINITNKCIDLISSMSMGSNEYSDFLKINNTKTFKNSTTVE